jgi:hypothetical protein
MWEDLPECRKRRSRQGLKFRDSNNSVEALLKDLMLVTE